MNKVSLCSLPLSRLEELLHRMKTLRAVLIGDMCLDVYWFADMTKSRLSRETPHHPLPVVSEQMSAGAGGNAVVNLATLCDRVTPVGVIGNDWRGRCLGEVFAKQGVSTDFLVRSDSVITSAYCKPMRRGYAGVDVEDPRIDFELREPISREIEDALLEKLNAACLDADVLCVSDQFEFGCVTDRIRARINELAGNGLLTVVDSRARIGLYRSCILKPNELECARVLESLGSSFDHKSENDEELARAALALGEYTNSSVCLTLGERGCLISRDGESVRIPAVKTQPPIDTVGAGDCFLSALSLSLAAGATTAEAGIIGTLASAITVKKINTTGSASRDELCTLRASLEAL